MNQNIKSLIICSHCVNEKINEQRIRSYQDNGTKPGRKPKKKRQPKPDSRLEGTLSFVSIGDYGGASVICMQCSCCCKTTIVHMPHIFPSYENTQIDNPAKYSINHQLVNATHKMGVGGDGLDNFFAHTCLAGNPLSRNWNRFRFGHVETTAEESVVAVSVEAMLEASMEEIRLTLQGDKIQMEELQKEMGPNYTLAEYMSLDEESRHALTFRPKLTVLYDMGWQKT